MASLFRRRRKSFVVNEPDPTYNVIYLGNVLTVMAKGDNCTDKPLSLIWRTYCSRTRPDIPMTLTVTKSGLQGTTKQQGLTEYWAHRITYCSSPSSSQYPRLFCWIYKHEGKKLKPELRCHAVLCKKLEHPPAIAQLLQEKITSALKDYKREKLSRQNTRLSTAAAIESGAISGLPNVPQRRLMLSVGGQNFRPPMNRSKSAPRLHAIVECGHDEEDDPGTTTTTISSATMLTAYSINEEDEDVFDDDEHPESTSSAIDFHDMSSAQFDFRECPFAESSSASSPTASSAASSDDYASFRLDDLDKLRISNDESDGDQPIMNKNDRSRNPIVHRRRSKHSANDAEIDSISDESGYHDEKSSMEEEDIIEEDEEEEEKFVTAL